MPRDLPPLSRRRLLAAAVSAGAAVPLATLAARLAHAGPAALSPAVAAELDRATLCLTGGDGGGRKLKLSWNAASVCLPSVVVAVEQGYFQKHGLDVELVNFGGSTDQLLEAIATGKSDGGVGMALRWLKPLEQGFDVKITAGIHGGCIRLLTPKAGPINSLADLKGKTIAVADMAAPARNFFSIQLKKAGIDPNSEVEWRVFPGELLRAALDKGEAQALADNDPKTYLWLKDGALKEIGNNIAGDYARRACCILGVRGEIVRNEPGVARALTAALLDASHHSTTKPEDAVKALRPVAPNATDDDLRSLVAYHTHHHNPTGRQLREEIRLYAEELKLGSVFKASTDTAKFADRVFADVTSI